MYIKRYTIAAFILVILVGWYIYSFITQERISIDFFGVVLPSLSIAVWVVIPLVIFYIASVMHMAFYSMLGSLTHRKYDKDYERLVDAIVNAYLGKEDRHHSFKTSRYDLLGLIVDNTTVFPNDTLKADTSNEKINTVIKLIQDIKNGEVVELKKYSLSSNNPLVIQNNRNRYKSDIISAEDILSSSDKYDEKLCKEAYIDFVKIAPVYAIENYKNSLTKEALYVILSRVNADENSLEISNETLIMLFNCLDLTVKDYINISSSLSIQMLPEQRIKLFETISEDNEDAMEAYIFTLFDLEMLEAADEILEISQPDEYLNFKSYRALKECNKNFNINLFV